MEPAAPFQPRRATPSGSWARAIRTARNRATLSSFGALAAVALTLFHLYTGVFGIFTGLVQRPIHLLLALLVVFTAYPLRKKREDRALNHVASPILVVAATLCLGYIFVSVDSIAARAGEATDTELVLAAFTLALVLEGTRRVVGWPLVIIAILFLIYALAGSSFPGPLAHRGYSLERTLSQLYVGLQGIFSTPLGVSANVVSLFVIFGTVLEASGAGRTLMDLATAGSGWARGGAAKPAVVGSALMGSITGTAVANVVTTGSITIPLMKRVGYKPAEAGGIEAASSTGSQLAPPVMGAAAFILADLTETPYIQVVLAAIIPTLLYYLSLFAQVHLKAVRLDLPRLPWSELPSAFEALKTGGHLLIPLALVFYFLIVGRSPIFAVTYPILLALLLAAVRRTTRMGPRRIWHALQRAGEMILPVATSTAAAGIVIGVVGLTGLGARMSSIILSLGGDSLAFVLVLTMIVSIMLGMGLPTAPAYIIAAAITAPTLVEFGVPILAAHLFVFYSAVLSAITPPLAMAAFVASGLAGAPPMAIAIHAVRYGIVAFLVPFFFVYNPVLLGQGDALAIAVALGTAAVGIMGLSAGLQGAWLFPIGLGTRLVLAALGVLSIVPQPRLSGVAVGLLVLLSGVGYATRRSKERRQTRPDS